jgi:tripartite-type tricarboxylate transporter receptor subunit TctC
MRLLRRIAGIAALAFSTLAAGQDWPTRPITILAAAPAGGTTDVIARSLADVIERLVRAAGVRLD